MTTNPDVNVSRVRADHLELADRHAPGLVEGLYPQGSIALGDYRPGASDIDVVAVAGKAPGAEVLRRIHRAMSARHAKPHSDGLDRR
ncbi:Nucleotidyltransferase domain-containing protein [Sinosporangium album]|uniref:Nucleotidyltransferase domain-containing protein n=1 Tax=Sinosporangium album TaxID=504805 RepID=A0A1G8IUS5_9ACTN|nr:nucleotidyltransferase domain-containing protein [Sinosporangium album]SDI22457.1 Nucleotidyltransferase domain-containing protein [Sinosporangium album]